MQTMVPHSQDTIAIGNPFQKRIAIKSLQNRKKEHKWRGQERQQAQTG